ncbi:MAG: hypothetical protein Greene071421_399 [Parcubacteria group bacterium Greene0714_21]|nr:MAG: hypothetical protein Greene041639_52 [Parcubacteria group bacterium Greene0416_39]TSC98162.1 MAG: hypothetical protein Greene101447_125 [Parcubacteria group bacterium Greene1014_47]TSD04033.1 MAG: hypothetical protein Greene071421_399 [Parcubacteria group bacterium Greene0714_21]
MNVQGLVAELNLAAKARQYGVPLWQHPQFLFFVMGVIIAVSSIFSYSLGRRYISDPYLVSLSVLFFTALFLAIAFLITRSFERLAEAARLKTEFLNIVSHQLRSPLSNLKWTLEVMMEGKSEKSEAEKAEYFRILKENSARMQELVNDLLLASKIEEGKLQSERKEFSLLELVKDVAGEFAPWTQASNVTIAVEGGSQIQRIVSDPSLVRQVLGNLVDNAVRYASQQESVIIISYTKQGKNVKIEVQDNGLGIPAGDQKYIFQRFFRSRNASRQETQGSGLGLYIAKAMVKSLGGDIGFESQEHKGSKFWFTIPFNQSSSA